ncbi:hypothetical protein [Endozoicomonas sp. ONNA2]|uniref:hypothetical protein n=1 Tax=Endozoicomonas sp. ONNA2 TaxID=2828741 RepID=UPI002148C571|nr:hypothetical protein [Endozoicomonas sp. ONNA2]
MPWFLKRGRVVATITANNGNGTSQAELRDGSVITVKGESVSVGEKVFIRKGGDQRGYAEFGAV